LQASIFQAVAVLLAAISGLLVDGVELGLMSLSRKS
jgi:hypothetical protein